MLPACRTFAPKLSFPLIVSEIFGPRVTAKKKKDLTVMRTFTTEHNTTFMCRKEDNGWILKVVWTLACSYLFSGSACSSGKWMKSSCLYHAWEGRQISIDLQSYCKGRTEEAGGEILTLLVNQGRTGRFSFFTGICIGGQRNSNDMLLGKTLHCLEPLYLQPCLELDAGGLWEIDAY